MREKIIEIISLIEAMHDVEIIYACESGSRAWGFESENSDWDIRFIYTRKVEDYLTIYPEGSLTLDTNSSELIKKFDKYELDFAGWDLKKVLFQLSKGNPDLISWLQSPIIYKSSKFVDPLFSLSMEFFKSVSAYYHYVHMAERNFNQYIKNPEGELVKRKKYLYVLRPLINCMWIELFKSAPPMLFENVYENKYIRPQLENRSVYRSLINLIQMKRDGDELDLMPRLSGIDDFCEDLITIYKEKALTEKTQDVDYNKLNEIFKSIIIKGEYNG
jgi:uncharacterized protein